MACNCAKCRSGSGLGHYGRVPPLAQHGFRLSIPGGPAGGQYHGRVTANPTEIGYHGRLARTLSGVNPYDHRLIPDPFWRAPGELPPRPNAAGDLNIHTVGHMPHVPGYSMVPGGLFPASRLGAWRLGAALPVVNPPTTPTTQLPVLSAPIADPIVTPVTGPILFNTPNPTCPPGQGWNWQLNKCVTGMMPQPTFCSSAGGCNMLDPSTGKWVHIPGTGQPPGTTTVPLPIPGRQHPPGTITDSCGPGMYRDAAGNCTTDWSHPYPIAVPPQPSPIVPAPTDGTPSAGQPGCVTGQFDAQGNCIPSTVPGAMAPNWFTDPSQELIQGIPNWGLLAGGLGGFLLLMTAMQRGGKR